MDKTSLIEYIKEIGLDKKLEDFLVGHIEESEMNQELLDRVADVIELRADQLKFEGEMYADVADKTEDLKNNGEMLDEEYKAKSNELFDEFMTKIQAVADEPETTTEVVESAGVTPEVPALEPVVEIEPVSTVEPEVMAETAAPEPVVAKPEEPAMSEPVVPVAVEPVPVPTPVVADYVAKPEVKPAWDAEPTESQNLNSAPVEPLADLVEPAAPEMVVPVSQPLAQAAPWPLTQPVETSMADQAVVPAPLPPSPMGSNMSQSFEMDPTKTGNSY